ncbi:MAG: hypothetical protein WDO14_11790 [Bacteroidota bacterium]
MFRLLLLVGLALTSCAPAYISNTRNTPMFGEANEFAGSVALSSGVDVQAAYSVSNHVAVMANFNTVQKKYSPEGQPSFNRDHIFGEGALGYFTRTKASRFELFAGYGMGSGTSYESYYFFHTQSQEVITKANYNRIFIQPSIGTNKKKFNLIFTARVSMVGFEKYTTDDPIATPKVYKPTGYQVMFEPSITARAHLAGNLRGFFQLGINRSLKEVDFNYVPVQASIGIQIHTGQLRTRVY